MLTCTPGKALLRGDALGRHDCVPRAAPPCRLFLATHLRDLDRIVDAIQKIRPTEDDVSGAHPVLQSACTTIECPHVAHAAHVRNLPLAKTASAFNRLLSTECVGSYPDADHACMHACMPLVDRCRGA